MSPNVIVDDHDPSIHYGGPGWSRSGLPQEFSNTTTVSSSIGSTVTYTFNGTALSVWGSIADNTSSSASYAIDGGSPVTVSTGVFPDLQVWENLFSWSSLQDGSHTISITTRSGIFSLDFLLVTPSANASLDGATLMVDDIDPEIEWLPTTSWSGLGTYPEFQNTTHDTGVAGSTMQYKFSGTAVSVWGSIQTDIPSTSYTIDGGSPFTWNTPPTTDKLYHQQFYASPNLTAGDHTLVVTVGNNSGAVIIDYLLVEVSSSSPSPPASSPSTATAALPAGTSQSSSSTQSSTKTPIAAIAGGAVAGVLILLALLAGLFALFRRRRRQRRPVERQYFDDDDGSPARTTPFVAVPAGEPMMLYDTTPTRGRLASSTSNAHSNATSDTETTDYFQGSSSVPLTHSTSTGTRAPDTAYSASSAPQFPSTHESRSPAVLPLHISNPQTPRERNQQFPGERSPRFAGDGTSQFSGERTSLPSKRGQPEREAPPPPPPRVHTDGGVRLDVEHVPDEEEPAELPPVYGNYDT